MTPTGLADGLEVGVLVRLCAAFVRRFGEFAPWRVDRAGGSPASPCGVLGVQFEARPNVPVSQMRLRRVGNPVWRPTLRFRSQSETPQRAGQSVLVAHPLEGTVVHERHLAALL